MPVMESLVQHRLEQLVEDGLPLLVVQLIYPDREPCGYIQRGPARLGVRPDHRLEHFGLLLPTLEVELAGAWTVIRDLHPRVLYLVHRVDAMKASDLVLEPRWQRFIDLVHICLLYTSDAADDLLCVDLGGR